MRGQELLRFKVPSFAERDKRDITPEAACPCPQIYFDPILGNHARTLPSVTLRYNTRLDSFRQDADGVSAETTDMASGATRTLRAQYLVGCDGPSGIVREALGIGIEGIGAISHSVNLFFRSPELATAHDKGWARFYRADRRDRLLGRADPDRRQGAVAADRIRRAAEPGRSRFPAAAR